MPRQKQGRDTHWNTITALLHLLRRQMPVCLVLASSLPEPLSAPLQCYNHTGRALWKSPLQMPAHSCTEVLST